MERRQRYGVYFILKSMELGTNFGWWPPNIQLPTRTTALSAARFTLHPLLLLYPRPSAGPDRAVCRLVLAISITYYLNGHHFTE
jgi:hypothetical protein